MTRSVYISGFRKAKGGRVAVNDKACGEVLLEAGIASSADVRDAVGAAGAAQEAWAAKPPTERGDVLRKFAQLCELYADELGQWIIRETGSIPPKADRALWTSIASGNGLRSTSRFHPILF